MAHQGFVPCYFISTFISTAFSIMLLFIDLRKFIHLIYQASSASKEYQNWLKKGMFLTTVYPPHCNLSILHIIFKACLSKRRDMNERDETGRTALHYVR
jgi:hypothetical protein